MRYKYLTALTAFILMILSGCGGSGGSNVAGAAASLTSPPICPNGTMKTPTGQSPSNLLCDAPKLLSISPANNTSDVSVEAFAGVVVTTDSPLDITSITTDNIKLTSVGTNVSGVVAAIGVNGFKFTPTSKLGYSQTYLFTVNVKDLLGKTFTEAINFSTPPISCNAPKVSNEARNLCVMPLFSEAKSAFPDLTYAYRFFNINAQNFGSVVQAFSLVTKGSNQAIFGMAIQKGTDNWNGKVTEPCKSKVFLFKLNITGIFEDITDQLIEGINDLGGCVRKAKKFDLNGDGVLDVVFAVNQEDGRSADLGSTYTAQMAALASLPSGKYRVVKFGDLDWYHSIGVGIGKDGLAFVTGAGFYGSKNIGYGFTGVTSSPKNTSLPWITPNTFEFVSSGNGNVTDFLVQTGAYPNLLSVDGYQVQSDGTWKLTNTIQSPFVVVAQENFLSYSGDKGVVPVADMNGTKILLGGGFAITESCKIRLAPNEPVSVIMKMELPTIPNYVPGKTIDQNELVVGNKLIGVQIADGKIKSLPLTIINEVIFDGLNGYINFECFDFDGDGYQDIVVYRMGKGKGGNQQNFTDSSPFIYINQKDMTFKRTESNLVPAMLPDHYTDQLTTVIGDFNGDGINDAILFPSNPGSSVSGDIKFFKGSR